MSPPSRMVRRCIFRRNAHRVTECTPSLSAVDVECAVDRTWFSQRCRARGQGIEIHRGSKLLPSSVFISGTCMSDNPYQSTVPEPSARSETQAGVSAERQAYNLVTDTVTGVNARWSDNRFQLIVVTLAAAIGAVVMALLAMLNPDWSLPWYGGALIGSFLGLVFGILASGVILMVYRTLRHLRGKHD